MKTETEASATGLRSIAIIALMLIASHLFAANRPGDISGVPVNALERGRSYDDHGNDRKTIEEYDRAIRLRPGSAENYNHRGVAYVKLGNLENGLKDFYAAIALDKNFADAYYNRGIVYFRLGSFGRAITDLDMAIKLNPKYADAYYDLTVAYGKLGRVRKETEDFVKAFDLSQHSRADRPGEDLRKGDEKTDEPGTFRKSSDEPAGGDDRQRKVLDTQTEVKSSMEIRIKEEERLQKESATVAVVTRQDPFADTNKTISSLTAIDWFKKGYSSVISGNHQEAIDACDKAIERNPSFAEAYYVRGTAYYYLGDPKRAIQDLDKTIELDATYADAYYIRGIAFNTLGRPGQATENYKIAARLGVKSAQDHLRGQGTVW